MMLKTSESRSIPCWMLCSFGRRLRFPRQVKGAGIENVGFTGSMAPIHVLDLGVFSGEMPRPVRRRRANGRPRRCANHQGVVIAGAMAGPDGLASTGRQRAPVWAAIIRTEESPSSCCRGPSRNINRRRVGGIEDDGSKT